MKSTKKFILILVSILFLLTGCQEKALEPTAYPTEISEPEIHPTSTPELLPPASIEVSSTSTALPGWETYKWTTVEEIIETHLPYVEEAPNGLTLFGINESKYRVHVTYLGESRPVTEDHYALLYAFLQLYFPPEEIDSWITQFEEELLMQEGETTYWMPCQAATADTIRKYIRPNTEMTVYITYPGTNAFHRPLDWVFWIMEWDYY